MPGHPCAPEAGAGTDPARARVIGHGHQLGRGVDQPDYASPPFASLGRAALQASVTQRGILYGFHPRWVSNSALTPSNVRTPFSMIRGRGSDWPDLLASL